LRRITLLGGIYFGCFAVSEAAAVTVVYPLVSEFVFRREIPLCRLAKVIREAMILVGLILAIFPPSCPWPPGSTFATCIRESHFSRRWNSAI
jgi:TRAP-type C4-dicarboxylate transport system permease large subunit